MLKEWTAKLFQYGHNPLVRNLSCLNCLEKLHSRIIYGLVEERGDKKVIRVKKYLCRYSFYLFYKLIYFI